MIKKFAKKFSSVRMQLVASVFVAIAPVLALTYVINQPWFWKFAPDWMRNYFVDVPWVSLTVGLLALVAAWFGGERFILRQVRALSNAAKRLGKGDMGSRTGLHESPGELGQLAEVFDGMAESLQQRVKELELAEKNLLNRALQQTVVAALGQFALTNSDLEALESQAVMLIAQTLEVEYCGLWQRLPDGQLRLQAGVGWKRDCAGHAKIPGNDRSQIAFTLNSGEPVIVPVAEDGEKFSASPFLDEHNAVSGVSVAIRTPEKTYGVLGVYSIREREFTGDDVQFLLAVANALAAAVERRQAEAEMQKLAEFARLNPNPVMELAADGTITYFNQAALRLAGEVRREHPRDVLPPGIGDLVKTCLATGENCGWTSNHASRDARAVLVAASRDCEPGGALLCDGHHRPVESRGAIVAGAENGIGRSARRGRRA
jgi:PAS domain-containing protein